MSIEGLDTDLEISIPSFKSACQHASYSVDNICATSKTN